MSFVPTSTTPAGFPTVQQFSSAYDVTELRVTPADDEHVRINDALYGHLQGRADQPNGARPVFARLPGYALHFELWPDEGVPLETLEMPYRVVEDIGVHPVPSHETVLFARPRHTIRLIRLSRRGEESIE